MQSPMTSTGASHAQLLLVPTVALVRGFEFDAPAPAQAAPASRTVSAIAQERAPLREGFRIGDLHLMIRY